MCMVSVYSKIYLGNLPPPCSKFSMFCMYVYENLWTVSNVTGHTGYSNVTMNPTIQSSGSDNKDFKVNSEFNKEPMLRYKNWCNMGNESR